MKGQTDLFDEIIVDNFAGGGARARGWCKNKIGGDAGAGKENRNMTKQSEIAALRPRVGELYPALRYRTIGLAYGYIITLGNTPVIVRKGECVEVPAKKKEE